MDSIYVLQSSNLWFSVNKSGGKYAIKDHIFIADVSKHGNVSYTSDENVARMNLATLRRYIKRLDKVGHDYNIYQIINNEPVEITITTLKFDLL